ncbi:hypothetical protein pb186bvf_001342 [Paramecium bursaria]
MRRYFSHIKYGFSQVEAKWKRFIINGEPLVFNLERSFKNDNQDNLNNYLKQNIRSLSLSDLILSYNYKKIYPDIMKAIITEIYVRIFTKEEHLTSAECKLYFNTIHIYDSSQETLLYRQMMLLGQQYYNQFTFLEKTNYVVQFENLGLIDDLIIDKYILEIKADDSLDQLHTPQLVKLLQFFDILNHPIKHLDPEVIPAILNNYLNRFMNQELLRESINPNERLKIFLKEFPSYFTQEQIERTQDVYQKFLEFYATDENSYIHQKYKKTNYFDVVYNIFKYYNPRIISNIIPQLAAQDQLEQTQLLMLSKYNYMNPKVCEIILNQFKSNVKNDIELKYNLYLNYLMSINYTQSLPQIGIKIDWVQKRVQEILENKLDSFNIVEALNRYSELDRNFSIIKFESNLIEQLITQNFSDNYKIISRNKLNELIQDFYQRQERKLNKQFKYLIQYKKTVKAKQLFDLDSFFERLVQLGQICKLNDRFGLQANTNIVTNLVESNLLFKDILKNCIIIQKFNMLQFNKKITTKIQELKQQIDDTLNKLNTPQKYREFFSQDIHSMNKIDNYLYNQIFLYYPNFYYELFKGDLEFKQKYKVFQKDLPLEKMYNSNTIPKIYFNSEIILQHTAFKEHIHQSLLLDQQDWLMNYSYYPFLSDFICHKQKIVINLLEYPRLIRGCNKVLNRMTDLGQTYYKNEGYQIYNIGPQEYVADRLDQLNFMKSKFVYLLLGFITLSFSRSIDHKQVLAEIDEYHVGNTFMNAIQIAMANGSPVPEIQSYINNIRFMLEQEQKDADAYIQNTQQQCQKLLLDFSTNYAYHASQLKAHQRIVEENNNNLQRSLNKIAEVSVEIEDNIKKTNRGQSERDVQYAEFQSKIKDHSEAIAAIDEAYSLIEHLQGGASFIQVKGRFNKVLQRLLNQPKSFQLLFQPIGNMMNQIASKQGSDAAKKILQLLSNLRIQISDTKSSDEDIEQQQSANWEKFLGDLTNEKNTLQDQRQNLEQAILNYQSIVQESEEKVEYHSIEFERNKQNVEMQDQWCRQQQDLYTLDTQSRRETLQLISLIVDHIQDKIVTLKEYLRERLKI